MEDDVLLALDERAGRELGERVAVQTPFLDQVQPAQVCAWVSQPGPADQLLDLAVVEHRVSLVDHQLDAVLERHPQHQGPVRQDVVRHQLRIPFLHGAVNAD